VKKIGIICLTLVLALGSLGIGYAHWSDTLYIEGTVETGQVLVGFVDQLTDDDGVVDNMDKDWDDDGSDPLALEECPTVCTNCDNIGKDVAETTCELLEQKECCTGDLAEHDGVPCYGLMKITMDNVYPQYNPTVWMDIANCGSVPVNVVGAWIVSGPPGVDKETPSTWIPLPKCNMVQVDLDGDGDDDIGIGFSSELEEPQQIDPCDVAQYDLHFCVKQTYPQCTTLTFEVKIAAVQWNKTLVWPDDFIE
jgi:hypothetical protein